MTRESRADADGYFAIASLPPGTIDLIVSAAGFAERRVTGVRLEVGQAAEVDVPLQLSAVEEQLTVAGDAGSVDVLGSVVGSVISAREIESLPLNGRNFLELAFLTPGSAPAPNFDPTKAQSVIVSSAGQAGRGGNITIDGMDDNDDVVGGPLQNIPQDAVQEFQVATNRFSAELGRSAGSAINVVTRSGSDVPARIGRSLSSRSGMAGAARDARSRSRRGPAVRPPATVVHARGSAAAVRRSSRSVRSRSGIRTAAR